MSPRLSFAVLSLALSAAPAVLAQAAPAPSFDAPRAYTGYSQPEITQCSTTDAGTRECTVPAMTAGRYLIEAAGVATASGAKAAQTLQIKLDGTPCAATNPAPFAGKQGLHIGCEVTFLTDRPIRVTALYAADGGTPDPKGPQLAFHRIGWNGIVGARPIVFRPRPAAAK